jgi:hypothetical protein
VNQQNKNEALPNELHVKPLHGQRETVWSGILAFGVIGPYFFEDETGSAVAVTSERCIQVVNEVLFPELRCRDIDPAIFWFQQDGKTSHSVRRSMNTLRNVFERGMICRYGDISGPALSVDLSACDFFSYCYL